MILEANPALRLAMVIPTRDRPEPLRRALRSLSEQTRRPDKVAVVSSGRMASEYRQVVDEFAELPIIYQHVSSESASAQRNVGLEAVKDDADLIAYVDDDVVFEPGSMVAMAAFWARARNDVGGAGFNVRNNTAPETSRKWALGPVRGLYNLFVGDGQAKGTILRSGFPTPIYPAKKDIEVKWLETMAVVFRKEVAERIHFDEFYAGYSYLEFIDFTYSISKHHRLFVVSGAWISHYSSPIRNSYLLGKKQVLNRIYFVRKHPELSLPRCLGALALHTAFNVAVGMMLRDKGYFQRAHGNLAGFAQAAMGRLNPVTGGVK